MTVGVAAGFMVGMDDGDTWDLTPWDLASAIRLGLDLEKDRSALDELADAMLVWADSEADRLTPAAVTRLWDDELEAEIPSGLDRVAEHGDDWARAAAAVPVEFERDPRGAAITHAQELAQEVSSRDHPWFVCTGCLEEGLSHAPAESRHELARQVAIVARRNADVPEAEVAAALAGAVNEPPLERLGTPERRAAVRARLGRIGSPAETSMPVLAAELRLIGGEALSARAADDDVWAVVCEALLVDVAGPELN
jgi:hypothetical protein